MSAPNLFLVYVSDTEASTAFYRDLLEIEPSFTSPHYVAFEIAPGVFFALWSGHGQPADGTAGGADRIPRSETGLMVAGPASTIDALFTAWTAKGVRVIAAPHDAVFGRTFVVADPDGNHIRVAPFD